MNEYQHMARAMEIFASYDDDSASVSAEHDEIYAGPDPTVVSAEHIAELGQLDWHPVPDSNTFRMFT